MIYALTVACVGLVISPALCLHVLIRYLNERDERTRQEIASLVERAQVQQTAMAAQFLRHLAENAQRESKDRQVWANRVQAPETAVAQSVAMEEVELGPPDTEASEMREFLKMQNAFTEDA